ncbi:hypothetical protein EMCRGX_G014560 [Ephydatia muelleri]
MDDEMLAVASQQTLSLFITEEQLVLEQAAVVCCLHVALVTCECHWLTSCTTPLSELVEMALFSSSAACLSSSGQQRSIAFDAGLTCDGLSSEQQGQLTTPDAAMHSVRHLVHTSELHTSILVAVKEHVAHPLLPARETPDVLSHLDKERE